MFSCPTGITSTDIVELMCSPPWNVGVSEALTRLYVGLAVNWPIRQMLLAGFPEGLDDRREAMFGAYGSKSAGGAMNLKLACIDGAGHCQLHVTIEADYDLWKLAVRSETRRNVFALEPAALDQFLAQNVGTKLFANGFGCPRRLRIAAKRALQGGVGDFLE